MDPLVFLDAQAPKMRFPDPLAVIQSAGKKGFHEVLEMDAESAAKLSEILGGGE